MDLTNGAPPLSVRGSTARFCDAGTPAAGITVAGPVLVVGAARDGVRAAMDAEVR
jgi:hypothetical protein